MLTRNLEVKALITLLYLPLMCCHICTQNDVRMPPSITGGPSRRSVIYRNGDSVTLDCKGKGVPAVTYEWKKNGIELSLNHPNIDKGTDGTITIKNAAASEEGFYQCFVKNQYGTALSTTAHIRRAILDSAPVTPTTLQKTVQEGMPFHIQADPRKSFPNPTYGWEMATDTVDKNPFPIRPSRRVQIAENGDLYFAYALPEDALDGRIYKCTTYNPYLDVKAGGTYTKLTVARSTINPFAPTLAFTSKTQTVAVIGGSVTLRCFFYGYPEPTITWSGPKNTLPIGSYTQNSFDTELVINNVTASDEGDYICTASNANGRNTSTLQIRVEDVPKFQNKMDSPYDVNVTEGESVTFNCNASAKPEAIITWFQNGQPIDTDNPPKRFAFSNNKKSLTIRDVCRDCVNQDRETDLTVIQCNASNVHGYAFAQGYVNVLMKTEMTMRGPNKVSVDFLEEKRFVFRCDVTSDPSRPSTVRWHKIEPFDDLVRDEPPYVYVTKDILVIMIDPNCSDKCTKYLGEYRCVADNGYSQENRTMAVTFEHKSPPEKGQSVWTIIVVAGATGLVLFLIGMFLGFRSKGRVGSINGRTKDTKLPNLPSLYERIGYNSIRIPLVGIGNNGRSMQRACSMYERIGYDSIDQVLEEIRNREGAASHPPNVHRFISYDTIDTPLIEAINRGRPMLDEDTMYDDTGFSIPLAEVVNHGKIDQNQGHGGYESVRIESENFPNSNEKSEAMKTYSDLSRKEINSYMDLGPVNVNPYLGLCSKQVNPDLDMGQKEMNPYFDLCSKEGNSCLDMGKKEVNPDLDMGQKEMNPYLDLCSKEGNLCLDMGKKEVNPHLGMGQKEVDPNLYMTSDLIHAPASPAQREADYLVLKN